MVIVVDRIEGNILGLLTMAAQLVAPGSINFLHREAGGRIYLALTAERCEELGLELVTRRPDSLAEAPATVTIDARDTPTHGVSYHDQAFTMQVAIDPTKGLKDIVRGGHIQPLKARPGGVLERAGHTEAAIDLAQAAGLHPAGVLGEIVNDDGSIARSASLADFGQAYGLKIVAIPDLIVYRRRHTRIIERDVITSLPTAFGEFAAVGYRSLIDNLEHVAVIKGDVEGQSNVLVYIHTKCLTSDAFHALTCDCAAQLNAALRLIELEELGVLLYLDHRGLDAHGHSDPLSEQCRDGVGAQILNDLGVRSVRVLTDRPNTIRDIMGQGVSVEGQVPVSPDRKTPGERPAVA